MSWPLFWFRLRHSILLSWRCWLALLALVLLQAVLIYAVDLNRWAILAINSVVGGWLGHLAGRADIEEQEERHERRYRAFRERWEAAMHSTVELLNERHRT